MSDSEVLAERLKAARVEAGYRKRIDAARALVAQRDNGVALGTIKNSLERWESGASAPSAAAQQDLIALYELDESFFASRDEEIREKVDALAAKLDRVVALLETTPGRAREIAAEATETLAQERQPTD